MSRVLILVEGQTEETFAKKVLAPHLQDLGVYLVPRVLVTKRVKAGGHFKGGVTRYQRVANDVRALLRDSDAKLVTTMIDYYGLPRDFPGLASRPQADCQARVAHVEAAFRADIADPRFEPHLSLHEFEGMIFSALDRCAFVFAGSPHAVERLQKETARFASPEEINEGQETAPSRRIVRAFPQYRKVLHGPTAALAIGLDAIRARCPHFSSWLARLEGLSPRPG